MKCLSSLLSVRMHGENIFGGYFYLFYRFSEKISVGNFHAIVYKRRADQYCSKWKNVTVLFF